MTSPQQKKKVYDMLSPRIAKNRAHRRKVGKEEAKGPQTPPTVDNYRMNKPLVARSLNIQPVVQKRRVLAKTEGMPAVNGKSGDEIVKKAVTKVKPKKPTPDISAAAISQKDLKKEIKGVKQKRKKSSS